MKCDIHLRAYIILAAFLVVASADTLSEQVVETTVCGVAGGPLSYNGKMVHIRGRVENSDHDLLLSSETCKREKVVLEYPDRLSVKPTADFRLRRDRNFKRLEHVLGAKNKDGSYRFEVDATFTGRLDATESAGFVRNESGKIIGLQGFGHPFPFSRFRLVIESVSDVVARKLPRPGSASAQK